MFLYRLLVFLLSPILWLLYPTKIINRNKWPKVRCIVTCNHYSNEDLIVFITNFYRKNITAVAKKELFDTKFLGWFAKRVDVISISRGENDMVAFKKIVDALNEDNQLLMFPEGTRNVSGSKEMLPLKHGVAFFAIKTKAKIVPTLLYRKPKLFRKNYLIIGEPFDLSEFYQLKDRSSLEQATEKIVQVNKDLRDELDNIVEHKKCK